MTFSELFNKAAEELPEGWEIVAHVEKDSGWIELIEPDGLEIALPGDEGMENDFLFALKAARGEV